MNLQEIQALPLAASTEEIKAPDSRYAQPVELTEEEIAKALQKADSKSANLLQATPMPEDDASKELVLELVALNREIELSEAKYRKAQTEEVHGLAARISTLQNHKTRLSTALLAGMSN